MPAATATITRTDMVGICKYTGKRIAGIAYLRQRIDTLLTTPLVTRVMRRYWGSKLPRLVDRPTDAALHIDLYAATALALKQWEPELKVSRVRITAISVGTVDLALEGTYTELGTEQSQAVRLAVSLARQGVIA
ncbi:GPW/gp25 family protein [Burkholderia arboris]|uniref:GPW/gp25 family protein n=2 Tax=Burkholderia cepacia complex TaxID=87882 RepID=A0ABT8PJ60_9BURK|nr:MULTISPECIES: GPW/gp25 family protein [Burkholderia cepacia complex]MCA8032015.1 GPW/gp25 family protein [Burkholderia arboris]MDN7935185.1 GPW/gp25 family protein [Burkholderia metallica]